jgi:hypothetical protein
MKEHQHIEWKKEWRDEYLRWICGFANAEGGILVIGRDDNGKAIGVTDLVPLLSPEPDTSCDKKPEFFRIRHKKKFATSSVLLSNAGSLLLSDPNSIFNQIE